MITTKTLSWMEIVVRRCCCRGLVLWCRVKPLSVMTASHSDGWFISHLSHFWSNTLLMTSEKQRKMAQVIRSATCEGDLHEAPGFDQAESWPWWLFGEWTSGWMDIFLSLYLQFCLSNTQEILRKCYFYCKPLVNDSVSWLWFQCIPFKVQVLHLRCFWEIVAL